MQFLASVSSSDITFVDVTFLMITAPILQLLCQCCPSMFNLHKATGHLLAS